MDVVGYMYNEPNNNVGTLTGGGLIKSGIRTPSVSGSITNEIPSTRIAGGSYEKT